MLIVRIKVGLSTVMDHYFCRSCLSMWKQGHIMDSCPGCQGHQDMGWKPTDLIRVYGHILEKEGKVFFPNMQRVCPPVVPFSQLGKRDVDVSVARQWLQTSNVLPGFKTQQGKFLNAFEKNTSKEHWDLLDPEIQLRIHKKLHLRYT